MNCDCTETCRLMDWSDQFQPATRELMVFTKSKTRYFDLDAVRTPVAHPHQRLPAKTPDRGMKYEGPRIPLGPYDASTSAGAPPLDWWNIPLLDGEEPTKYGPDEPQRIEKPRNRQSEPSAGRAGPGKWDSFPNVRMEGGGAPPLDWWNIPLLEGEEPTKYGPKDGPIGGGPAGKKAAGIGTGRTQEDADRWRDNLSVRTEHPLGSPPLDWWNIPPGGYPGAHYAVWPPELLVKPIKAMCPEKVCRVCGEASRRITEATHDVDEQRMRRDREQLKRVDRVGVMRADNGAGPFLPTQVTTLGFSDCGHDDYRPGLVLDPFAGSGTTLSVATGHGRDAIGIDLDERNYELALDRVGPLILSRGEIGTEPARRISS